MEEWLTDNLTPGSNVGLDPKYYGKLEWDSLQTALGKSNITLTHVNHINLVNDVWTVRPDCPKDPVRELGIEFSGKSTYSKTLEIYNEMDRERVELLIITELDEIACKIKIDQSILNSVKHYSRTFISFDFLRGKINSVHLFQKGC